MRNRQILKLVAGFRRFHEKYFAREKSVYDKLSEGQSPKTLIIGCSDSRVDPTLLSSASPGELFVVRNVANLVPPYESAVHGRHGISAAIEFAVVHLKVENIIILGHRQCGGIRALMQDAAQNESFIGRWMAIAYSAREKVLKKYSDRDFESQCKECEKEAIISSIDNLKSFPFVKHALDQEKINIFGIYFDLEQGTLLHFDEGSQTFYSLNVDKPRQDVDEKTAKL